MDTVFPYAFFGARIRYLRRARGCHFGVVTWTMPKRDRLDYWVEVKYRYRRPTIANAQRAKSKCANAKNDSN